MMEGHDGEPVLMEGHDGEPVLMEDMMEALS